MAVEEEHPITLGYGAIARRPTARVLLEAIESLPAGLTPEFYYRFEPNPKSKRLYLDKDWDRLVKRFVEIGGDGFFHHKDMLIMLDGFLCDPPARPEDDTEVPFVERGFYPYFGFFTEKDNGPAEPDQRFRALVEHFSRSFDIYHACAGGGNWPSPILAARGEVLIENPPTEHFNPQYDLGVKSYANAKAVFPGLSWITFLSQECVDDYGLDLAELERVSFSFQQVKDAKSPQPIYRVQFYENWQDWPDHLDMMIDLHLRADAHRFELAKYMEEIVPKRLHSAQNWPLWIKELQD